MIHCAGLYVVYAEVARVKFTGGTECTLAYVSNREHSKSMLTTFDGEEVIWKRRVRLTSVSDPVIRGMYDPTVKLYINRNSSEVYLTPVAGTTGLTYPYREE